MRAALILFLGFAAGAEPAVQASSDTVELVKLVLETPTAELPPDAVDPFLAVDPEALPKKLRVPYKSKRLELFNLLQMRQSQKRGVVRIPEKNCGPVQGSKAPDLQTLRFGQGMGLWAEIQQDEVNFVTKKTGCTEDEMVCEFSLQIVVAPDPRTKKPRRYYFLNPKDPLMAFVSEHRAGVGGNTKFFGLGGPSCYHSSP